MADSGSSLAAALAWPNVMPREEAMPIIVAAARRSLRLSKIPCETCGGLGEAPGLNLCPSCNGSGGGWPAELVAIVVSAKRSWIQRGQWAPPGFSIHPLEAQEACAVLDALDLYAKEAK